MKSPTDQNVQRMVNVRVAEKKLLTFDSSLGSGWEPLKVAIHYKHHKSPQSAWALARTVKSQPLNFERSPTSSPDVEQEIMNVDRDTDDDDLYTMQGHTFDDENVSRHLVGCSAQLKSAVALRKHKLVHKPKSVACDVCGATFREHTKMRRHMVVHNNEKPFKCTHEGCDQAFAHQWNLKMHERIHTDERHYSCSTCGKAFVQLSNMRAHERNVHKKVTDAVPQEER